MKITFLGASGFVTGSSYLLEINDFRLLIDCGLFQGSKIIKELNYGEFSYDPTNIDAVILTHAHIDHSGLIPKLIKKGYNGNIYATPETIDLDTVMLPDSGHIQEMEIERKNRKRTRAGLPELTPIYTAENALAAIDAFVPVKYNKNVSLSPDINFEFIDAGHILGSAHVILNIKEGDIWKKIVFSGDIGTMGQPYIEDPKKITDADIIVMENTYGNRKHIDKSNRLEILAGLINSAVALGGNIIIPAFAIERTQDILYYLGELQNSKAIPTLPIYVDSPLAVAATKIFQNHPENFDKETIELISTGKNPLSMKNLNFSITTEDSIKLNEIADGAIIISASGMADAGRIKHHLKHNLWKRNATVLFVGYQAEGTLGRRLIEGAEEVTIHGEKIAVHAQIKELSGFSAHADQSELLSWLLITGSKSENVVLVHGETSSLNDFSELVREKMGKNTIIPELGENIEFKNNGEVIRNKPEKPWLEVIEENLEKKSEVYQGKYIISEKDSKNKKVSISQVNRSYNMMTRNIQSIMDKAKKEKNYDKMIATFDSISKMLEELKK
ncbi:MAG: MBL fold metallo-hydrolase [Eubacteriales bacterium]